MGGTFLLQKYAAFGYHYGYVAIYIALPILSEQRYGDVRIRYTNDKRDAKDAASLWFYYYCNKEGQVSIHVRFAEIGGGRQLGEAEAYHTASGAQRGPRRGSC